jgi:hypothetical protein
MNINKNTIVLFLLLFLFLRHNGTIGSPSAITAVTYVSEKDESGGVPPGVQYALREINQAGKISAAAIEADVVDSTGKTPPQYEIAVKSAKEAGLPSLVVQAGDRVVKIVSAPKHEEQVMEAIK